MSTALLVGTTLPEVNSECDEEVYANGLGVALLDGTPDDIELWVRYIAHHTGLILDWYYSGTEAKVLLLGTEEERQIAINTMVYFADILSGRIIRFYNEEEASWTNGKPDPSWVCGWPHKFVCLLPTPGD